MWTRILIGLKLVSAKSASLDASRVKGRAGMKQPTRNVWGRTIRLACLSGMIACFLFSSLNGQQTPTKTDKALDDLRQIGIKILDAILKKDVVALLRFEPAKWRTEHEISLKDRNSDFYCFLVESHPGCASFGIVPSIFESLSGARRPSFVLNDWGVQKDGNRYGLLLFYDRSITPESSIRSRKFYCDPKNFKKIAFWTFMLVDGKWEPTTDLFNYQTDSPC
jgi:hypothetical protein